jgi:hypothetical protein
VAEPNSGCMAILFTDLIGRHVNFSEQMNAVPPNGEQLYCVYLIKPMDSYRVIKADLSLLSSFAGALVGLSPEIASRIVTLEHRGVFKGMYGDPAQLPPDARNTLRDPCHSTYFRVTVDGYEGGGFSLLAPF